MKTKAILAAMLVLAIGFAMAIPMDGNEATITIQHESKITFNANDGGVIELKYVSDVSKPVTITVTDASSGAQVFKNTYEFVSTGGQTESILVPLLGPGSGSKVLNFTFSDPEIKGFNITITYDAGFWSNWAVYAVFIAIALLIVALVIFKSRAPKAKNTLTFEQIEAMKQAERAEASQPKATKKSSGGSTERQKYLASKKKKE